MKNFKAFLLTIGVMILIGGAMAVFVYFPEYVIGIILTVAFFMIFRIIFLGIRDELN